MKDTLTGYLNHWADTAPDVTWMEDCVDGKLIPWTWSEARDEANAIAAWLEREFGPGGKINIGILSKNRAHWILADMAIMAAGQVTIPMFTTLPNETASYVIDFSELQMLFVGAAENWENVRKILPESVRVVALPGVDPAVEHLKWDDIIDEFRGQKPAHVPQADDLVSVVFTSGTTGMPKGVMQTHESNIIPIRRFNKAFKPGVHPQYFSYLPLSHIGERQLVEGACIVERGSIRFNEDLTTLLRDLSETRPAFFFGPPRIWEQLQQNIIGEFGSQEKLDRELQADPEGTGIRVQKMLGLDRSKYLLTAAAPTPPALIDWFGKLGIAVMEGFGQTEAMGLIANQHGARKIGSIGRAIEGVEIRISDQGELQARADGFSTGYYRQPEQTAEAFVNGWIYTGDKARVDEDGYVFLTGRVKDYFKTIHGKFVAPPPIEAKFSDNPFTEQQCLLGRGYSKTVMVCVLSELSQEKGREEIEEQLLSVTESVNQTLEKHARIGALIISTTPWTIENTMLTPTLKIRRSRVEEEFGEVAEPLARQAAEQHELKVHWD